MTIFKTEQEQFWAGGFGDDYISRNQDDGLLKSNIDLFKQIFAKTNGISSVIEFGANIGMNLLALQALIPDLALGGIEINEKAAEQLRTIQGVRAYHSSLFDYIPDRRWDLTLIKGVLIHINPAMLPQVYKLLYDGSDKYICIVEYYNPTPTEVIYRGHTEKLFKRDFAGEMLDMYPELRLVDYGFKYHRDNKYYDDINWFLLEK